MSSENEIRFINLIDNIIVSNEKMINEIIPDWSKKIDKLHSVINTVREDIQTYRTTYSEIYEKNLLQMKDIESEVVALDKELKDTKQIADHLDIELSQTTKECDVQCKKHQRAMKMKEVPPNVKERLAKAKFEFNMNLKLTNVRWDYTLQDDTTVRGFILNKKTGNTKTFVYDCNDPDVVENMWNDIDSIEEDWLEKHDKENSPVN